MHVIIITIIVTIDKDIIILLHAIHVSVCIFFRNNCLNVCRKTYNNTGINILICNDKSLKIVLYLRILFLVIKKINLNYQDFTSNGCIRECYSHKNSLENSQLKLIYLSHAL